MLGLPWDVRTVGWKMRTRLVSIYIRSLTRVFPNARLPSPPSSLRAINMYRSYEIVVDEIGAVQLI